MADASPTAERLVENLRSWIPGAGEGNTMMFWRGDGRQSDACFQAADEIERLRAESRALRGLLVEGPDADELIDQRLRDLGLPVEKDGWRPIETAPTEGNFLVALDTCPHLSWPAHAGDGHIYSNAHGILNEPDEFKHTPTRATHWRPALPAPCSPVETKAVPPTKFYRMQNKTNKGQFADFYASVWDLIVIPEPSENG